MKGWHKDWKKGEKKKKKKASPLVSEVTEEADWQVFSSLTKSSILFVWARLNVSPCVQSLSSV